MASQHVLLFKVGPECLITCIFIHPCPPPTFPLLLLSKSRVFLRNLCKPEWCKGMKQLPLIYMEKVLRVPRVKNSIALSITPLQTPLGFSDTLGPRLRTHLANGCTEPMEIKHRCSQFKAIGLKLRCECGSWEGAWQGHSYFLVGAASIRVPCKIFF